MRRSPSTTTGPSSNSRLRSAKLEAVSGSGSMKMSRWSKAAMRRICSDSSMPLPKTSPDMSPTPTTVKGVVWMSMSISRKWRLTASHAPRAGDAHLLVVVAGRAAGRERVTQPEAVRLGYGVGGVGEGRRALVGGHHQVGIVRRPWRMTSGGGTMAVAVEVVGDVRAASRRRSCRPRCLPRTPPRGCRSPAAISARSRPWRRRHDDGVLDLLRLDEAQHLGAEVLRAGRTSASHRARPCRSAGAGLPRAASRRRSRGRAGAAACPRCGADRP